MNPTDLATLAAWSGATLSGTIPEGTTIARLSKDTRTLQPGDLYIALRGGQFDGNLFAARALELGAAAVLVDRPDSAALPAGCPALVCEDTLAALTRLADAYRQTLDLRVVGITGSNGKTSTKEFVAAVLATRFSVTKTQGNLNNHIGLPLSVLSADASHSAAVWEIGMNHPGEIAPLAAVARPDTAIITNIGVAHIEYLGSRDNIALEKGTLAEAVPSEGTVVLNGDDDMTPGLARRCRGRVLTAGVVHGEITASDIRNSLSSAQFTVHFEGKSYPAEIPLPGIHMVQNALLALAAGSALGVPLEQGIEGLRATRPAGGRLEKKSVRGVHVLDDSYNANPDSVVAALATLHSVAATGRRVAVLGRMGELGSHAEAGYRSCGKAAARHADILILVGPECAPAAAAARESGMGRIHEVADAAAAAILLKNLTRPGDTVLLKGSRSASMENILTHFES